MVQVKVVLGTVLILFLLILLRKKNNKPMNKVNGETKIFGVIADPIEHVKAPSIYNNRWMNNHVYDECKVIPTLPNQYLASLS